MAEPTDETLGDFGIVVTLEDLREKVEAMGGKLDAIVGHLESIAATLAAVADAGSGHYCEGPCD